MTTPTLTINRKCSRCPRTEQREVSIADVSKMAKEGKNTVPTGPKAVSITIDEKTVFEFEFLCTPCTQIVADHVKSIVTKPKRAQSLRGESEDARKK